MRLSQVERPQPLAFAIRLPALDPSPGQQAINSLVVVVPPVVVVEPVRPNSVPRTTRG